MDTMMGSSDDDDDQHTLPLPTLAFDKQSPCVSVRARGRSLPIAISITRSPDKAGYAPVILVRLAGSRASGDGLFGLGREGEDGSVT